MGFRQAAVLSATCFFLGVLFICLNVDYRVLFEPLTDEVARDGLEFYTTFFHAPPAIKALMHAIMGVGIIGLVGKLVKMDESAKWFDGSSLVAYIFALSVYLSVGLPASRTIATPVEGVDTREDQIEALRLLSAGNTIIIALLGGVLFLQAGEEYARRAEAKELARFAELKKETSAAETSAAGETKKDQ
ncbi:Shr3 amino acid permease chaperone [Phanerochaete sordida]|uniref:Shr3 amino acid permease chaperone n=1 Tax=Phanerochaete sordida TaxID=48140 RepID=A0A9P3LEK8_9APHY|nr:Shr3 amino acid permease chaperone [Phanerochaete sordida]